MMRSQSSAEAATTFVDRILFWAIALSSAAFVAVLALSAYWDPTIVWLHLFQSLQYVAIVALAARRNRWGYFFGFDVAAFWIYVATFVTNFVESGYHHLEISIRTGDLSGADQMIAVFAVVSQVVLALACTIAYLRLATRSSSDWIRSFASLAVAVGYMLACFALFQPRYLAIVPRLVHPHGWNDVQKSLAPSRLEPILIWPSNSPA